MKVNVDNIPEDGLRLKEKIDPKKLCLTLDGQGINFLQSVDVEAFIKKTGSEAFADVKLEAPVEYTCSRCLARIENIFKKTFSVNYEVKPGDIIEIDEDIRQEMILDYPMKVVCKPDCRGLCPNCGQNLNIAECECK